MTLSYDEAKQKMAQHGQDHVLRFWDRLDEQQRAGLLTQIADLDLDALARMRALLAQNEAPVTADIRPADVVQLSGPARQEAREAGEAALRSGKVGCVLVAGGQGTRLGYDGPKGCFPVGPVSNASLFRIHARKILALERKYGAPVPFYIMTSLENDGPTRAFFKEHGFFGLDPDRVRFFSQGLWSAMTDDGLLVLERPDRIFTSPDGHGGLLSALHMRGMLDDMARRGLETLFYFQVDNPLVEIADPAFVGLHRARQAEMSVKVCAKSGPEEKVGVVVTRAGRDAVVEYSELTREQMYATGPGGELMFRYGSVAIHMFSLDFLIRAAGVPMPIHKARKKVPFCDEAGRTVKPETPNAVKFEKFIFDLLPEAKRTLNMEFAREDEFSPVKNATGEDSAETARRDMMRKAARWLTLCGVTVPRSENGEPLHKLEIDPCYACCPEDLRAKLDSDFKIEGDIFLEA